MISFEKSFLYGWEGYNYSLFKTINAMHGETYNALMTFISEVTNREYRIFYLYAVIAWAILNFARMKISGRVDANKHLIKWIGAMVVLTAAILICHEIITWLKAYFLYPRPYVVFGPQEVRMLVYRAAINEDDLWSFPSGHAAFMTALITSLWPVLSGGMRFIGASLIVAECWSRIAVGMHFPADVLAGFCIAFVTTLLLRHTLYPVLRLVRIQC
jgi:signal peptidase II